MDSDLVAPCVDFSKQRADRRVIDLVATIDVVSSSSRNEIERAAHTHLLARLHEPRKRVTQVACMTRAADRARGTESLSRGREIAMAKNVAAHLANQARRLLTGNA